MQKYSCMHKQTITLHKNCPQEQSVKDVTQKSNAIPPTFIQAHTHTHTHTRPVSEFYRLV